MKYINKLLMTSLIFIILSCFVFISFASDSTYVWSPIQNTAPTSNSIQNFENDNPLNLESESAILIEQYTGQILYSHNIHKQLRPASVTKIMSILLIMEKIHEGTLSMDDKISCSENASSMGGSQIWLDTRETLSVSDMLKAICVVSANDCVVAMAEHIAGSESAFVDMMNSKARQLGMNDTTFKNCHGIDEDGHITSANDISIMSRELLTKYPEITKYTTIWMDTLRDGKSELVNTNKLIRNYKGATGLKTGSTSLALYNLSASATRDDLSLIAVIMKAPSTKVRFNEAEKLLDYGFNNFSYKQFAKKDDIIKNINVDKGVYPTVDISFESNAGILLKKGAEGNIEQNINLPETIVAPVSKGQNVGYVEYKTNGNTILKIDLIANENINKITYISMCKKIFFNWFNLLR